MKKFILSSILFLSLSFAAFSQVAINSNYYIELSDTNANIAYREILFSSSPISSNQTTNGAAGYCIMNNPNILTNGVSSFIPAGTPAGLYYIAARNNDTTGQQSIWCNPVIVNYLIAPNPPGGLKIVKIP